MKHVSLIELSLRHAYYTDGRCADLLIVPSEETTQLLRNHRCVWGVTNDAVRIQVAVDDAGSPFLPFSANTTLRFALQLLNREFALFTDLTGLSGSSAQPLPLYTNAGLSAEANGQLQLSSSLSGGPRSRDVLAAVDIILPTIAAGSAWPSQSYHVKFAAKRTRWAYYCVTDLSSSAEELSIVDASPAGTTDLLVFSAANRTNLETDPDLMDPTGVQLRAQYPSMRCVRLISDDLVTCQQQPRKYLELRRGEERLVGPLPNPSLRNVAKEDLLFQIVKYRTQPFLTQ